MTAAAAEQGIVVRRSQRAERSWIEHYLDGAWGAGQIVSRGRVHDASSLPAFLAVDADAVVGLATYHADAAECELVTLDALVRGKGIGSLLLARVREEAIDLGCRRLWLITTNDNLDAIRFYQRRGMRFAAVHPGAVDQARLIKPSIPSVGAYGIPIHDELEFESAPLDAPRPKC